MNNSIGDNNDTVSDTIDPQVTAVESFLADLKKNLTVKYGELSILNDSVETYRLILFEPGNSEGVTSAMITISEISDSAHLTVKYEQLGKGIQVSERNLSSTQWIQFLAEINGAYFWSMQESAQESATNNQLTYWSLQGKRNPVYHRQGTILYHSVTRQSPYHGSFRNACELLITFSEDAVLIDVFIGS